MAETFDHEQFTCQIKQLHNEFHLKLRLYDFEAYTEKKMHQLQRLKRNAIVTRRYELAADLRIIERACAEHLDLKSRYNIEKSMFILEKDHLLFFHVGTAINDQQAKSGFDQCIQDIGEQNNADYLPFK